MKGYTYKLYNDGMKPAAQATVKYTREELVEMTTFQLRNICHKERLVEGLSNTLDREGLIRVILKYLSAEDVLFITSKREDGFERIQRAIHRYMKIPMQGDGGIRVPARLILYASMGVDVSDGYYVHAAAGLTPSNVLLVNDRMELCGILNLKQVEGRPGEFYLAADHGAEWVLTANRQYSLLFFRKRDSEYLYRTYYETHNQPPMNIQYYKVPLAELEIRKLEETDAVLAIDFGTSNTTAGAYLYNGYVSNLNSYDLSSGRVKLDSINYVQFPDTTGKRPEWIEVLPTIVSAVDCSDPDHIRYSFGYDVLKNMRKNGYNSRASVFRGIKRWVNDITRMEEVMDHHGNVAAVSRSDILRAFIQYVVGTAERQFKCRFRHLHITSPVKLKTQFAEMFATILPGYHIESEDGLDEGMAVLYNTIADQLDRGGFVDGEEYEALIIDCGGGTTDLSSCRFRIDEGHIAYRLDIHTSYENGETNFGGNNITYRIMQYMKIVFANYYTGRRNLSDIDSIIDIPGNDLFRYVDEYGVSLVYANLEKCYQEAESVIPTQFKLFESCSRDEYERVRGNFHFLWGIADRMKQEFFRKTGILRNRFDSDSEGLAENDLKITAVDRWAISINDKGRFYDEFHVPDVVFNIREIEKLIKGDIYEIVRKFLEDFYMNGQLQNFSIIKLTGQSCRIDVFREALKEFVPGRSIEFRQKAEDAERVSDLKMACLRGAIRYLNAKKMGSIEAEITHDAPAIPYSVSAFTHTGAEKVLISSLDRSGVRGTISRPEQTAEVEFYLKTTSEQGIWLRNVYVNRPSSYKMVRYEEIAEIYGAYIEQDDTDSIMNGEVKFFVFTNNNQWGFHVVPVSRREEKLYLGPKQFFAFENDLSEMDFFDGMK